MVSHKKCGFFLAKNLIDVKYEINLEKIQRLIVLGILTVGNGINQWKKVCSTASTLFQVDGGGQGGYGIFYVLLQEST